MVMELMEAVLARISWGLGSRASVSGVNFAGNRSEIPSQEVGQ